MDKRCGNCVYFHPYAATSGPDKDHGYCPVAHNRHPHKDSYCERCTASEPTSVGDLILEVEELRERVGKLEDRVEMLENPPVWITTTTTPSCPYFVTWANSSGDETVTTGECEQDMGVTDTGGE